MKYYRDWWLLTTFWWGLLMLDTVLFVVADWPWPSDFFGFCVQLLAGLGAIGLFIWAIVLCMARLDTHFEKLPSGEELENLKANEELDLQFKLLKQEEELLQRRQQLAARREAYVQKLERESGLR